MRRYVGVLRGSDMLAFCVGKWLERNGKFVGEVREGGVSPQSKDQGRGETEFEYLGDKVLFMMR